MAYEIPTTSDPDRQFEIVLGANLLTLRTYFNGTTPGWFLDITDDGGASLARGLAIVPGVNLLASRPDLTGTLGQLRTATSDGGNNTDPAGLGTVARLYWFAPGEFEALAAQVAAPAALTPLPFDTGALYA